MKTPNDDTIGRVEDQLILLSARKHCSDDIINRIRRLLTARLDWTYVLHQTYAHRVYPLVYNTLKMFRNDQAVETLLPQLRSDTYQNGARNLLLKQELLRLIHRCQEMNIPVMPLKGPTLADFVYGDLSLRVFADLDILVPPHQVYQVKPILVSLGYQPEIWLNPGQEQTYLRIACEYNFDRKLEDGTSFHVEVHWNILPPWACIPLAPDQLWEDSYQTTYGDVPIYQMSPENQFLALCLHAWKHYWTWLQWICDLNEFLGQHAASLKWDHIAARSRSLRIERIITTSLQVVNALLGRELPKALIASDSSNCLSCPLPAQAQRRLYPNHHAPSTNFQKHRFYLAFKESLSDRLKYCAWLLVMPSQTDFQEVHLPSWITFLYWLIRPIRLLLKTMTGRQRL